RQTLAQHGVVVGEQPAPGRGGGWKGGHGRSRAIAVLASPGPIAIFGAGAIHRAGASGKPRIACGDPRRVAAYHAPMPTPRARKTE
ncbi:MAG: hypothetical protein ABW032_11440, partial [Burkholderiaceae bacterium]